MVVCFADALLAWDTNCVYLHVRKSAVLSAVDTQECPRAVDGRSIDRDNFFPELCVCSVEALGGNHPAAIERRTFYMPRNKSSPMRVKASFKGNRLTTQLDLFQVRATARLVAKK
jgi:hypothetical protein